MDDYGFSNKNDGDTIVIRVKPPTLSTAGADPIIVRTGKRP